MTDVRDLLEIIERGIRNFFQDAIGQSRENPQFSWIFTGPDPRLENMF